MMAFMEIPDGPAVGNKVALKAPILQMIHQILVGAAGFAVGAVVRAHHGFHLGFLHQLFKGGQVGFLHVLFAGDSVELVPQVLRAGMNGEVLGAGGSLHGFSASLQSVHKKLTSIPGEMPEDKEKIGDLCAELLAIKGMHSPKKENDGKPIEMLNERKLEERKSEIKASPGFQNMLQKHSTQELYQAATDRTQNTLSGLLDKNEPEIPEADIKLKTNKKVTKAL